MNFGDEFCIAKLQKSHMNIALQNFHFELQPWRDFRMYQQSSGFTRGAENISHEIQNMTVHVLGLTAKHSDMQEVLQIVWQPLAMQQVMCF